MILGFLLSVPAASVTSLASEREAGIDRVQRWKRVEGDNKGGENRAGEGCCRVRKK